MPGRLYAKPNQRFVMYISNNLREEIEDWVDKMDITLAEFGREAFETYLENKKREQRHAQLAETCRLFDVTSDRVDRDWASTETDSW
jgi:hypothetical protein